MHFEWTAHPDVLKGQFPHHAHFAKPISVQTHAGFGQCVLEIKRAQMTDSFGGGPKQPLRHVQRKGPENGGQKPFQFHRIQILLKLGCDMRIGQAVENKYRPVAGDVSRQNAFDGALSGVEQLPCAIWKPAQCAEIVEDSRGFPKPMICARVFRTRAQNAFFQMLGKGAAGHRAAQHDPRGPDRPMRARRFIKQAACKRVFGIHMDQPWCSASCLLYRAAREHAVML